MFIGVIPERAERRVSGIYTSDRGLDSGLADCAAPRNAGGNAKIAD